MPGELWELADILERTRVEDFVVENGSHHSFGEVAREVLSLTGGLSFTELDSN